MPGDKDDAFACGLSRAQMLLADHADPQRRRQQASDPVNDKWNDAQFHGQGFGAFNF